MFNERKEANIKPQNKLCSLIKSPSQKKKRF